MNFVSSLAIICDLSLYSNTFVMNCGMLPFLRTLYYYYLLIYWHIASS
jgi:hypothetical protein